MNFIALQPNVGPKSGTPGVAQEGSPAPAAGGGSAAGGGWIMFLPLLMILPLFLLQGRRQKKEAAARSQLKRGDRVVSNAGIVGELMEMDDKFAKVKIAPGITVQMIAATVAPLDASTAAADAGKGDSKAPDKLASADKK